MSLALRDPAGYVSPEDLLRTTQVSSWDLRLMARACDRSIAAHGEATLAIHHLRAHVTELCASAEHPYRETYRLIGEVERAVQRSLLATGDAERIAHEIGGAR